MNFIRKSAFSAATCLQGATLAAALMTFGGATAAHAQDAASTAPADSAQCVDDNGNGVCDKDEKDQIVVTGSRIKLPNLTNKEPTVTLGAKYLEDRGITNVADALNEIPGFRGSVTPQGSQGSFGQGVNFINAFGLGSNRTLTLLNGRRVVTSNVSSVFNNASFGTQVDLNVIPTILIDHVDRVSIGGAPVYGSDAIAGTVNIVLKRRYQGLKLTANWGETDRGDNQHWSIQGAWGHNLGDRANLTIAAGYERVDGVLFNSRDFYRANLGNLTNPTTAQAALFGPLGRNPTNDGRVNPNIGFNDTTTDGFPGSVLVRGVTIPSLTRGGLITTGSQQYSLMFDPSGNLVPFNRGILYGGTITSAAARASGGNGFNFNDYSQLTSDIERINVNMFFNLDVSDNVRFFAEGMYFRGYGNELVQQPSFNSTLFGGVSGPLTFQVTNPFLTTQAQGVLAANGYTSTFRLSRANADLADLTGYSRNQLFRFVGGFEGDFNVGGRKFNWEISLNWGRDEFNDYSQNINQQNFVNAINVTRNTSGQIVCTTVQNVLGTPTAPIADSNCVPLNLFGEGLASPAAKAYIIQQTRAKSVQEQWVINANLGGTLFEIFSNPVAFNIGYEHRDESSAFKPDSFLAAGLGRSVAIAPTSGSYNLDEFFGEILVPLIRPENNFFISKAEAYGRIRHVNNTVNGNFTAWSAGGSLAVIPDIELRGNFTRSFRAPAVTELFAPRTNIFTTVPDLCSPANIAAGPAPTVRTANCNAFLARYPTATPLAASLATVPGVSGGNPTLGNEQADSYTFGTILRPRFLPGFSLAIDYLNIHLTNPISQLTATTIASGCFDNTSFDASDPANGNQFCSLIRRDSAGQVIVDPLNPGVTTGFVNGQQIRFSGYQGELNYETKLDKLGISGQLEVAVDVFYVRNRLNDITGVAPAASHGTVGDPIWQGQARVRYSNKVWGTSVNVNYTGQQLISRFNRGGSPNDTREFDHYNPYATVDTSVWVKFSDFRITGTVTNLFDRIGQKYFGYYIPGSVNDSFGRRYTISVSKEF